MALWNHQPLTEYCYGTVKSSVIYRKWLLAAQQMFGNNCVQVEMQTSISLHVCAGPSCSIECPWSPSLSPHLLLLWLIVQRVSCILMWMGGLFIWIQKQIVVVRVACSCVLERSKFCTLGQGVWQLILNAGNPLEGNPVTLRYFMRAGLSLFCAVPRVFWSLLPCIPSLSALLRPLGPRVVPPGLRGLCPAGWACPLRGGPAPQAFPFHPPASLLRPAQGLSRFLCARN